MVLPKNLDFIFINNSCYSGSVVEAFRKQGLIPKHGLVLTSASAWEKSANRILRRLLPTWRSRKKFLKRNNWKVISGKMVVKFSNDLLETTEDGIEVISSIDPYALQEFMFKKPRLTSANASTFQRCGKSLDYLLFPAAD